MLVRTLILLIFMFGVLSVAGCGGSSGSDNNINNDETPAPEPLVFKDFEDPASLDDWTLTTTQNSTLDSASSYEGLQSFYVENPRPYTVHSTLELNDSLMFEAGKAYKISFAVQTQGDGVSDFFWEYVVEIMQDGSSLLYDGFNGPGGSTPSGWTTKTYFITAASSSPATLSFYSSIPSVWIDNVEVIEAIPDESNIPSTPGVVLSEAFEQDNSIDEWNISGAQSTFVDDTESFSGTNSLFVNIPTPFVTGAEVVFSDGVFVEAGKTYEISFATKAEGEGFADFSWDFTVMIQQGSSEDQRLIDGYSFATGESIMMDWDVQTLTFTTIDSTPLKLVFSSYITNVWIDDIEIREVP
jgi:hypothetical protein